MKWDDMPEYLKSFVMDRLHQARRDCVRRVTAARFDATPLQVAKNELAAVEAAIAKLESDQ